MADQLEEMVQIGKRKHKEENKERKKGKWEMRNQKMKGKRIGRGKEKETRKGQNTLKDIE